MPDLRLALSVVSLAAACAAPSDPPPPTAPEIPIALRDALTKSPYAYFRFTNREFEQRVCEELKASAESTPIVNLHGDAHVEQYAVMDHGRGLMDFDDAARGPAIIDVARFGVSVVITARMNGWAEHSDELLSTFWTGYRDAVSGSDIEAPVPRVVSRVRARFESDRGSFLDAAEALMRPRSMRADEVDPALRFGLSELTRALRARYPDKRDAFFEVDRVGALDIGIGSALTEKYLLRVRGETDEPEDDVILEAKRLREIDGVDCVARSPSDPFPVLVSQSQLAYRPYDYVGYVYFGPERAASRPDGQSYWDGTVFMVHSWIEDYVELSAKHSFESVDELREVVLDAGVQLGRGHRGASASANGAFREQLLAMANERYEDCLRIVNELAAETLERWESLRLESEGS